MPPAPTLEPAPAAPRRSGGFRSLLVAVGPLARRPSLWPVALGQVRRLAPSGWWRRPPFLPVPDASYLRFRLVTMYGSADGPIDAHDLLTYLEWCRTFPRTPARRPQLRAARDAHR